MIYLDYLTGCSLKIEGLANGKSIGSATGFIIKYESKYFLFTNWHVVSGRDPTTNKVIHSSLAMPDQILICHHHFYNLGEIVYKIEYLYDDNEKPKWLEHPRGKEVDVVAFRLSNIDSTIKINHFDLNLAKVDMIPEPGMPICIIGFPLGLSANSFPIWKTGHIASEPFIDYEFNKPAFLIDATTRGGMSGSPVVLRLNSGYKQSSGGYILNGATNTRFLGIYSGRIHENSEIGIVWRSEVIKDILGIT